MTALNFPVATADGQSFEADTGVIYIYKGTPPNGFWSATSSVAGQEQLDARYVEKAGDDMTGNLRVNASVGVGIDPPRKPLHVYAASADVNALIESGNADAWLAFKDNTTTDDASVYLGCRGNDMAFATNGSTKATLDGNGNFIPETDGTGGIGTNSTRWANGYFDTLDVTGTTTLRGTLDLADNDKLMLGSSDDMQLYHNGTNSWIDNNTGHLYIRNNVNDDDNSNIYIQAKAGENSIVCHDDSTVILYHNNVAALATSSAEVAGSVQIYENLIPDADNTGNVGTSAYTWNNGRFTNMTIDSTLSVRGAVDLADHDYIRLGDSDDWSIYRHSNDWTYINDKGNGIIFQDNGTDIMRLEDNGVFRPNTTNNCTIGTSSYYWYNGYFQNFNVSGTINVRGALDLADGDYIRLGNSDDWTIYRDANNWTYINDIGGNGIIFQDSGVNKMRLEDSGIFRPESNNNGQIGTTSYYWDNGYFRNFNISGTINVRGAIDLADNNILRLGSSDDAELFCNGSHLYLDLNGGIGNFYIRDGTTTRFTFDDAGHFTASGNITYNGQTFTCDRSVANENKYFDVRSDEYHDYIFRSLNLSGSSAQTAIQWSRNFFTLLKYAGSTKLTTTSSGIQVSGSISYSSDRRLKTDIEPITKPLDLVSKLNGVYFKWIEDLRPGVGLIAQEVEEVIPEVVHWLPAIKDPDPIKGVDYSSLVALLIEAVKELSDKVTALESNS